MQIRVVPALHGQCIGFHAYFGAKKRKFRGTGTGTVHSIMTELKQYCNGCKGTKGVQKERHQGWTRETIARGRTVTRNIVIHYMLLDIKI